MKIALIGRNGEGDILSGPERVARELHSQLLKKNSDVTFIEYFFSGYSDYSFLKKIFGRKNSSGNVLRMGIFPLILKLLKEQFDILHFINNQRFILIIFLLKPFLKGKFISSYHGLIKNEINGSQLKRTFLDLWIEKISLNKSHILIFPSKLLLNLFKKNYNFFEDKCRIIYNGVSEVFYKNPTFSLQRRERSEVKSEKKNFNFIYFNSFGKGLNELFSKIPETADYLLKIFVLGKEQKLLHTNKNIEINFVQPMNQTSLIEFLSDKHFIIKSSSIDSFSIFTAECMAMGVIPVVSENTGIKELIENNVNGFVYNTEDGGLPILLKNIFEEKYNLEKISFNASGIYEKLNWEKISEQYLVLYNYLSEQII